MHSDSTGSPYCRNETAELPYSIIQRLLVRDLFDMGYRIPQRSKLNLIITEVQLLSFVSSAGVRVGNLACGAYKT